MEEENIGDLGPARFDVVGDAPALADEWSPVLRLLPAPLAKTMNPRRLVVLCSDFENSVLHALEAAIFILHGDVVIWDVTVVVLEDILPTPAAPGLEAAHWSARLWQHSLRKLTP